MFSDVKQKMGRGNALFFTKESKRQIDPTPEIRKMRDLSAY
jgi:hypothetical protein